MATLFFWLCRPKTLELSSPLSFSHPLLVCQQVRAALFPEHIQGRHFSQMPPASMPSHAIMSSFVLCSHPLPLLCLFSRQQPARPSQRCQVKSVLCSESSRGSLSLSAKAKALAFTDEDVHVLAPVMSLTASPAVSSWTTCLLPLLALHWRPFPGALPLAGLFLPTALFCHVLQGLTEKPSL